MYRSPSCRIIWPQYPVKFVMVCRIQKWRLPEGCQQHSWHFLAEFVALYIALKLTYLLLLLRCSQKCLTKQKLFWREPALSVDVYSGWNVTNWWNFWMILVGNWYYGKSVISWKPNLIVGQRCSFGITFFWYHVFITCHFMYQFSFTVQMILFLAMTKA